MASLNVETNHRKTYQGAPATKINALEELERAVLCCFLWENSFYESGNNLAKRVAELIPKVHQTDLRSLVLKTRHEMNLRHVPLFMITEMLKNSLHKINLAPLIADTIGRPDDATELLAIYWKDGKKPLPKQMKKGIALGLQKFNEYQLAKYQNKGKIKLVDLFNLVHPVPKDTEQKKLWKKFVNKGLDAPDTWEVRLSAEGNKKEIWEEFLSEKKLGSLALLRNLRNMIDKGVSTTLIKEAIASANFAKVLPFRFIAAAKHAPKLESVLEAKMIEGVKQWGTLPGKTFLLVDVSGSMDAPISAKSDMTRMDAACALAIMLRETCEEVEIFTFSNSTVPVPDRRGFALSDAIVRSQFHGGTYLGNAVSFLNVQPVRNRLIVFTDEQSHDSVPDPMYDKPYMINVASYDRTVTTNKWVSISGFSEHVVDFIRMMEKM